MKHTRIFTAAALLVLAATLRADRFELADGSVINGKLVSAEGGKFKVETAFAGVIDIAQDKIKSFATDEAVNVGFSAGSAVLGRIESSGSGIKVVAADGQMTAATGNVAAVWRAGAESPEVRRLKAEAAAKERKWQYEASASITGRTGGSEKFAGAVGLKATLVSPKDKLVFAGVINRAQENGNDTADDWKAGVDYSNNFSGRAVWFARTDLAKDKIKLIDLRSTSAVGLGYQLGKSDTRDTQLRLGLSYIYETYSTAAPDFDSAGLDVSILNSQTLGWAKMNNSIVWTPSFDDFANYRLRHESSFDLPIKTGEFWKLRMGVVNDYQSQPAAGVEKLDTTYFTALILNWN